MHVFKPSLKTWAFYLLVAIITTLLIIATLVMANSIGVFQCKPDVKTRTPEQQKIGMLPNTLKGLACDRQGGLCVDALLVSNLRDHTVSDFIDAANHYPDVNTVCFSSRGGKTKIAKDLYKILQKYGYDTCMGGYYEISNQTDERVPADLFNDEESIINVTKPVCASSCALLLLAGEKRVAIGSNFELQVHRSGLNFCFLDSKHQLDTGAFIMVWFDYMIENAKNMKPSNKSRYYKQIQTKPFDDAELRLISFDDAIKWQVFTSELKEQPSD